MTAQKDMQKNTQTSETDVLDFTNLEAKLSNLTADDFLRTEQECRLAADVTSDISQSMNFCARLTAKAMQIEYQQIKALPLQKFFTVAMRTKAFLMQPLGEMVTQRNN